jgi:zinc/manganese transport system permease protein
MPDFLRDDFMQNAFMAGTIVAIVASIVGYFVVLRGLAFAAHALSHIGFAGAAGAVLLGVNPLLGLLAFTFVAASVMGYLGQRVEGRDVAIGIVLAFTLGLGVLFLQLYSAYAQEAFSILFGSIIGVSRSDVLTSLVIGLIVLTGLAVIFHPLLFSSVNFPVAEARGVPVRLVSAGFLLLLAMAVSEAVQVVGVLLIFTLLIAPPATAMFLTTRVLPAISISVVMAVGETWIGIVASYYTNYSVSFFIASIAVAMYGLARLAASMGLLDPRRSLVVGRAES